MSDNYKPTNNYMKSIEIEGMTIVRDYRPRRISTLAVAVAAFCLVTLAVFIIALSH